MAREAAAPPPGAHEARQGIVSYVLSDVVMAAKISHNNTHNTNPVGDCFFVCRIAAVVAAVKDLDKLLAALMCVHRERHGTCSVLLELKKPPLSSTARVR